MLDSRHKAAEIKQENRQGYDGVSDSQRKGKMNVPWHLSLLRKTHPGICLQRGSFISPPRRGFVARCEVCAGEISADRRDLGLLHISTHALGVIVASWPPCKLQFLLL